jgi:copper chaperone
MKTYKFKTNINCGGCVRAVTPQLDQLEEVESWQVDTDHPDKILKVTTEFGNQQLLIEAVERAGFKSESIPEHH